MTKIVCSVCESEDVQTKVWTKPNENFDRTCDLIDELIAEPAECWCCNCEENQKLIIVEEERIQTENSFAEEPETIESILDDSDKCEKFAEIVLDEIRGDEEQLRHIGSNVIKAYLDGDCDRLLIALCGWSMDSLLEKYQKVRVKYYTCPACQEEALKYAMIDTDGTNLEEGYSCGECGECFIGLDNQEVIEHNPQITEDDE